MRTQSFGKERVMFATGGMIGMDTFATKPGRTSRRLAQSVCALALVSGAGLAAAPAFAQTPIGGATMIQNEVLGHTGGAIGKLRRGDNVFKDQLVQTARESRAKFVFLDETNMAVGPESIVRLDEFVYNGNGAASRVTINATKGAFRFFSGNSPSNAYQVRTPQAVIGVRGTTYDVRIINGQTFIKLQEGAITACTSSRNQCRDLNTPGESLVVNDNSIEGPFPPSPNSWDFGDLCTGAASDLCNKTTRFAMNAPRPPPPAFTPPPPQRVRVTSLPPPPVFTPPPPVDMVPPVRVIEPLPPVIRPPRPPIVILDPQRPLHPDCRPGYGGRGRGCGETRPPKPPSGECGKSRHAGHGHCGQQTDRPGKGEKTRPPRRDFGHIFPNRPRPGLNRPGYNRPGLNRPGYERPRQIAPRFQPPQRFASRTPTRNYGGQRFNARPFNTPRMSAPRMSAPRMNAPRMNAPRMSRFGGGSRRR